MPPGLGVQGPEGLGAQHQRAAFQGGAYIHGLAVDVGAFLAWRADGAAEDRPQVGLDQMMAGDAPLGQPGIALGLQLPQSQRGEALLS